MKTTFKEIESLTITSDMASLILVESLIDDICQSQGVDEDNYGNILIAVTEAVNNAIQHGNANDTTKSVRLDVLFNEGEIQFKILDEGLGFDYKNLPDPTAPENIERENGRGIFLMEALSDKIEFNEKGNEVSLYFNLN